MAQNYVPILLVIVIIVLVAAFISGFFNAPSKSSNVTTITSIIAQTTSSYPSQNISSTAQSTSLSTSTGTTSYTSTIIPNSGSCNLVNLFINSSFGSNTIKCGWIGGNLYINMGAGNFGYSNLTITGADGIEYFKQMTTSDCLAYLTNIMLTAQNYTIVFKNGPGGGSCGMSELKLN